MRECGMCGGSGRHTFERCYECKGHGFVDDPEPDDAEFEEEEDEPMDDATRYALGSM
jgi:RecJ-like exonuclease